MTPVITAAMMVLRIAVLRQSDADKNWTGVIEEETTGVVALVFRTGVYL